MVQLCLSVFVAMWINHWQNKEEFDIERSINDNIPDLKFTILRYSIVLELTLKPPEWWLFLDISIVSVFHFTNVPKFQRDSTRVVVD